MTVEILLPSLQLHRFCIKPYWKFQAFKVQETALHVLCHESLSPCLAGSPLPRFGPNLRMHLKKSFRINAFQMSNRLTPSPKNSKPKPEPPRAACPFFIHWWEVSLLAMKTGSD